jgi:hypothetical protein
MELKRCIGLTSLLTVADPRSDTCYSGTSQDEIPVVISRSFSLERSLHTTNSGPLIM